MGRAAIKELRDLPEPELRQRIGQAHRELAQLRLRASHGALEQPHKLRSLRRDIARMLTAIGAQRQAPAPAKQPKQRAKTVTTRQGK